MYVKWAWYLAKAIRDQYLAEHPDAPIPNIDNADEIEHLDEDELQILFVQQVRFVTQYMINIASKSVSKNI